MSFIRYQLRKPFERITQNVNVIEVATVGVSVFTIGWLASHFRTHHHCEKQDKEDKHDTESIDCLQHEEVFHYWTLSETDRFIPTEKCVHPLELVKSHDLELSNSELPLTEVESVKLTSLVLDDALTSSSMSSPEWQSCTRGLLQDDGIEVEEPTRSWFSLFSQCCCCTGSKQSSSRKKTASAVSPEFELLISPLSQNHPIEQEGDVELNKMKSTMKITGRDMEMIMHLQSDLK